MTALKQHAFTPNSQSVQSVRPDGQNFTTSCLVDIYISENWSNDKNTNLILVRFNNHPVLNERYLLLCLLGKGGFSEVHKVRSYYVFLGHHWIFLTEETVRYTFSYPHALLASYFNSLKAINVRFLALGKMSEILEKSEFLRKTGGTCIQSGRYDKQF